MKSIIWFILLSSVITSCTATSTPHSTITPIHTSTGILADETRTPTNSVGATITPSPTKTVVPTTTATAEPTPTEEVETAQSVAEGLGYSEEPCADCVINDLIPEFPGARKELLSETDGVKGYWTDELGWVSTRGWEDAISQHYLFSGPFSQSVIEYDSRFFDYGLKGVLDGTIIEEPFEIKDVEGNVLATNRLAVNLFYNDAEGNLKSKIFPLILNVDGETVALDGMFEAVMDEWGYTGGEAIDFYKSRVIKGRYVKLPFFTSRENSENYEAKLIDLTEGEKKTLVIIRQYLEGREENLANFAETGEMSENIIMSHSQGSTFFGNDTVGVIDLPEK